MVESSGKPNPTVREAPVNRHGQLVPERFQTPTNNSTKNHQRKPAWFKTRIKLGASYREVKKTLADCGLHSVCEEANCPNIGECFSSGTATFLILGSVCTRGCRFCDVRKGRPRGVDHDEPRRIAEGVARLRLKQVVITSVTRDDLPDGGADIYAETIRELRARDRQVKIEILIPDFQGNLEALEIVLNSAPDVLNHNLETVPRLYQRVRPGANHQRSLDILKITAKDSRVPRAKSGIMVGLGETRAELESTIVDIARTGCEILTIGQYLAPSGWHLPVERFYPPEEFMELARYGEESGLAHVEAGPLVRSSYKAFHQVAQAQEKKPH